MKQERRQFIRQLGEARIRLYHPALGCLAARLEEWSPGAVRLWTEMPGRGGDDYADSYFQMETDFMDVIFTMQFVRRENQALVLRFVDEGELPGGDRL